MKSKINKTIEEIRLSDSLEERIQERYKALDSWLNRDSSTIKKYNPIIYPQGSVRTGTIIKPLGSRAYDVDLVCELQIDSQAISPIKFKEMIGNEIKEYMEQYSFKKEIINARKCFLCQRHEYQYEINIIK